MFEFVWLTFLFILTLECAQQSTKIHNNYFHYSTRVIFLNRIGKINF